MERYANAPRPAKKREGKVSGVLQSPQMDPNVEKEVYGISGTLSMYREKKGRRREDREGH